MCPFEAASHSGVVLLLDAASIDMPSENSSVSDYRIGTVFYFILCQRMQESLLDTE